MDNKRSFKRRHLFFYLQVTNTNNNKLLGYVVDITPNGLKIVSEDGCEKNSPLSLKMKLPDHTGQKKEIHFKAICKWSGKDVNSDFYANGFEITNLDDETLLIIKSIITEYGFEDLE